MNANVPKKMQAKFDDIMAEIEPFCVEYLNEEYAQVCREMTAKLARKRPSPLVRGQVTSWAAGIVYAVGQVNFLFDQSQTPYIPASDLAEAFGVASSTAGNKAKTIRDLLNIRMMDPDWTLPSRMDENITAWMIQVNGFIVDARRVSREIQEIAYEKGLIPYIPADKE
ncbi:MAG: DUF6398 domain-containing protein [Anaerolineae bacterium]